jgi:membrane protease YdiL (CAAX protease family)
LLVAEAAIFLLLGLVLLKQLLRYGIIAAGARESGRAERLRKATSGSRKQSEGRWGLTAIQGREVRLLGRDRNFLVQTLVMPIILVGTQIVFNQGVTAWLASINNHPEYLAIAAFGVAAYLLMFSAFQTLNAEGQALWMLYTFPVPLESILRQKALLWGAASLVYPVAIFGFAVASYGPALSMLQPAFLVLIGVPVFAIIATSLGVFACDPLAQNLQRRVKVSYTYLFLLLASTYLYSLYASSIWQRLSLLILTMLLAFALWQKARDHLPYLLDPAASPPARVSVSDGLIAALLFFVLQGIVLLIRSTDSHKLTGFDVLLAFSVAGATTFGVMRLAFWRLKSQGVPRVFGRGVAPALMLGVVGGAVASAAAILYLKLTLYLSLFETTQGTALLGSDYTALIFILAVVAAPIFEEFIFRGLIFGGLRRSMGVAGAVLASAAIFAIVHPPVSVIPVFGLGIVTALVYERTRLLIGPMAAHAVYNAVVVGFQYLYLTGA